MTSPTPIRPAPPAEKVTQHTALQVLGFLIVVLPLLVPLNVILWRIAVGPW